MPILSYLATTNMENNNPTIQLVIAALVLSLGITGVAVSDAIQLDTLGCTIVDPKTGMTCAEVAENPERDVYYIVDGSHIDNIELFEMAHQNPETVRWNLAHDAFVLKFDASELPRNFAGGQQALHDPMDNTEILEVLQGPEWKQIEGEIVKEETKKDFAIDDYLEE